MEMQGIRSRIDCKKNSMKQFKLVLYSDLLFPFCENPRPFLPFNRRFDKIAVVF